MYKLCGPGARAKTGVEAQKIADIREGLLLSLMGALEVLLASSSLPARKELFQRLWQKRGPVICLAELVFKISIKLLFFPNGLANPLRLELLEL